MKPHQVTSSRLRLAQLCGSLVAVVSMAAGAALGGVPWLGVVAAGLAGGLCYWWGHSDGYDRGYTQAWCDANYTRARR